VKQGGIIIFSVVAVLAIAWRLKRKWFCWLLNSLIYNFFVISNEYFRMIKIINILSFRICILVLLVIFSGFFLPLLGLLLNSNLLLSFFRFRLRQSFSKLLRLLLDRWLLSLWRRRGSRRRCWRQCSRFNSFNRCLWWYRSYSCSRRCRFWWVL
jgi:hypothetical protein